MVIEDGATPEEGELVVATIKPSSKTVPTLTSTSTWELKASSSSARLPRDGSRTFVGLSVKVSA